VSESNSSSYLYVALSITPYIFRIPRSLFPSSAPQHLFNSNQTRNDILCVRSRHVFLPPLPLILRSRGANIVSSVRLYGTRRLDKWAEEIPHKPSLVEFLQATVIASTSCIYHSNKLNAFSWGDLVWLVRLLFLFALYYMVTHEQYHGVQFFKRRQ